MAEFGEIIDVVEDELGEAEEGLEDLSAEERAEMEAEIAETRTAIEELSTTESGLQSFLKSLGSCVVDVAKFTAKNVAIGAILWGVNIALNKLLPQAAKETKKRMGDVIKALSDVIKAEGEINKKVLEWMTAHKDDTIVLDGIKLPMEAVLAKPVQPITTATEQAEIIANSLQEKVGDQVQFKCPTADDMRKFMNVTEVFIMAFTDLLTFILKNEDKVKELQSFPIKEAELIDISAKLNYAKALPLW